VAGCAIFFAAAVILVQLSGCSHDNRQTDLRGCIAKAEVQAKAYRQPVSETAQDRHDRIGIEVADCMKALGYQHDDGAMTEERCVDDVDYNFYCYVRRG
jgi:hypothetical protein